MIALTAPQLHTILASLRFYQMHGGGDPDLRTLMPHHISDTATNSGECQPLDDQKIDALCIDLNTSELAPTPS